MEEIPSWSDLLRIFAFSADHATGDHTRIIEDSILGNIDQAAIVLFAPGAPHGSMLDLGADDRGTGRSPFFGAIYRHLHHARPLGEGAAGVLHDDHAREDLALVIYSLIRFLHGVTAAAAVAP